MQPLVSLFPSLPPSFHPSTYSLLFFSSHIISFNSIYSPFFSNLFFSVLIFSLYFYYIKVEHCYNRSKVIMEPGMVFTIEPIFVEGARRISVWDDGWTAVTLDGGRYIQVHMILPFYSCYQVNASVSFCSCFEQNYIVASLSLYFSLSNFSLLCLFFFSFLFFFANSYFSFSFSYSFSLYLHSSPPLPSPFLSELLLYLHFFYIHISYRAAQFEHEVLITENGAEVMTVPA